MLFINTAIALTFLPAILSAPASAGTPSRNDFEDDFVNDFSPDFKGSVGKDAPVFADDDDDEFETMPSSGVDRKPTYGRRYDLDDENYDFTSGVGPDFDEDLGFSGRRGRPVYNEYQILVQTGSKWLSGTDSKIFVTFGDANGKTVSSFLSKKNMFDRRLNRNHLGVYKVSTASKLDDICMITIGNDMRGWFPSW